MPKFFEAFIRVRRRGAGYICITLSSHVQVPSENTPNSCNTLQIFCLEDLISAQAQSSSRSDRIQQDNVRTLGLSACTFSSPPPDTSGAISCFDIQYSMFLLPSHLNSSELSYPIAFCLCTRLPELSVARFLADESYEPERAIFGI